MVKPFFFFCELMSLPNKVQISIVQGFMWDIAPDFKALLVFAEHRYYGESMPYGNLSYKVSEILFIAMNKKQLLINLKI